MKFLYIEDDRIDQLHFQRLVRKRKEADLELFIAASLAQASAILKKEKIDLILSDCYLAEHTIFDIITMVKDIPIIAISGVADVDLIDKLKAKGIEHHFVKPMDKHVLTEIVNKKPQSAKNNEPEGTAKSSSDNEVFLNMDYLQQIAKNSANIKLEMLQIFIEVVSTEVQNIELYVVENAWKAISFSLHRMKSNMRLLGMKHAVEITNQLELKYRNHPDTANTNQANLKLLLMTLKKALLQVEQEITNLQTPSATSPN